MGIGPRKHGGRTRSHERPGAKVAVRRLAGTNEEKNSPDLVQENLSHQGPAGSGFAVKMGRPDIDQIKSGFTTSILETNFGKNANPRQTTPPITRDGLGHRALKPDDWDAHPDTNLTGAQRLHPAGVAADDGKPRGRISQKISSVCRGKAANAGAGQLRSRPKAGLSALHHKCHSPIENPRRA